MVPTSTPGTPHRAFVLPAQVSRSQGLAAVVMVVVVAEDRLLPLSLDRAAMNPIPIARDQRLAHDLGHLCHPPVVVASITVGRLLTHPGPGLGLLQVADAVAVEAADVTTTTTIEEEARALTMTAAVGAGVGSGAGGSGRIQRIHRVSGTWEVMCYKVQLLRRSWDG